MSPPFRFQSVLDYRTRIVEDKQVALGRAQQALIAVQQELQQLLRDRDMLAQQLSDAMASGVLQIDAVQHQYRYLAGLDRVIGAARKAVEQAEVERETARQALEQGLKERKTMEKLKEYDVESFVDSQRRAEAEAVDDLNISRYSRGAA